jgi:hypothetical protein
MKQQIIVIHGGDTHRTYREYLVALKKYKLNYRNLTQGGWKENLQSALGSKFEVELLKMPNPLNARYVEWAIMFRKLLPFLKGRPIFVGHSLGGIFLAKYLSENRLPKKMRATFLVAAPYGNDRRRIRNRSLADFILPKSLVRFQRQCRDIFLYQSEDDLSVPFSHLDKYRRALPEAHPVIFKNRGHFSQRTFPELVRHIKKL